VQVCRFKNLLLRGGMNDSAASSVAPPPATLIVHGRLQGRTDTERGVGFGSSDPLGCVFGGLSGDANGDLVGLVLVTMMFQTSLRYTQNDMVLSWIRRSISSSNASERLLVARSLSSG